MLNEILDGNIQILDSVSNWEHSIELASIPLIKKNIIDKRYINAMISNINKIGFYVVLREYLAMPHARPEDGVIETGISFLKLNKHVLYGDNKINLIFVLAAKDSNSHIDMVMKLSELFQNDEDIDILMKSRTIKDIKNIIKKY